MLIKTTWGPNKGAPITHPSLHLLLQKGRVHFTSIHMSQPCLWKITCVRDTSLKEATALSCEMAGKCSVCRKQNKVHLFLFRVSGSLESKISSSVENVTCVETVAIWLLTHSPAVAVCCGCLLSCAFEHLSHGCTGKGWGHPRCHIYVWLRYTAGIAQITVVS